MAMQGKPFPGWPSNWDESRLEELENESRLEELEKRIIASKIDRFNTHYWQSPKGLEPFPITPPEPVYENILHAYFIGGPLDGKQQMIKDCVVIRNLTNGIPWAFMVPEDPVKIPLSDEFITGQTLHYAYYTAAAVPKKLSEHFTDIQIITLVFKE